MLSELLGLVQENAVGTWIEMYGWKVCSILLALLLAFIVSPRLALTTWSLYPARRRSSRRGTSLKRLIWTLLPASWHPATELSHPSNDPNISESIERGECLSLLEVLDLVGLEGASALAAQVKGKRLEQKKLLSKNMGNGNGC